MFSDKVLDPIHKFLEINKGKTGLLEYVGQLWPLSDIEKKRGLFPVTLRTILL